MASVNTLQDNQRTPLLISGDNCREAFSSNAKISNCSEMIHQQGLRTHLQQTSASYLPGYPLRQMKEFMCHTLNGPRLVIAVLIVIPFVLLGCADHNRTDYSQLGLVQVSGRVTLDGQPLPSAVVTFESEDGQFSYGLTNSEGEFSLRLDSEMTGVTPGKKVVRISTTRKILGLNTGDSGQGEGEGGEDNAGKLSPAHIEEKVPAKYNKNSELIVEVSSSQRRFEFNLISTEE